MKSFSTVRDTQRGTQSYMEKRRRRREIEVNKRISSVQFSRSVMSVFATPWIAACQASLSITNSRSLLKLMCIELAISSNHLILCCPLLLPSIFPSISVFSNESALCTGGQSIGVSASPSVLPMNIQDWFPLGWIGWIPHPRQSTNLLSISKDLPMLDISYKCNHIICALL